MKIFLVWGGTCALLSPSKEDIPCGLSAVKRVLCYSPARTEEDTSLFVWGETCAWPFPSHLAGLLICNAIFLLTGASATSDDMIRLRRDILSNYSRGIVPKHNQSQALHVNMSFFLIMIHNLVSSFLTRLSSSLWFTIWSVHFYHVSLAHHKSQSRLILTGLSSSSWFAIWSHFNTSLFLGKLENWLFWLLSIVF